MHFGVFRCILVYFGIFRYILVYLRANILYKLRQARRKAGGEIVSCGSINGQVFAYLKPPNPASKAQRLFLNDESKLEDLCVRRMGISMAELSTGVVYQ